MRNSVISTSAFTKWPKCGYLFATILWSMDQPQSGIAFIATCSCPN